MFFGVILFYCLSLIIACYLWLVNIGKYKIPEKKYDKQFCIIIPVRNEKHNLSALFLSLEKINYELFEIIFIDDDSTDNSLKILNDFKLSSKLKITILEQKSHGNSPKKEAITLALNHTSAPYIMSTDADCELPPDILSIYAAYLYDNVFVAGPVTFTESSGSFLRKLWNDMQIVEFASLIGISAISMNLKKPNMCSGANMAYHRSVFFELGGYAGNQNLASGDDEFLMQKIIKAYPQQYQYILNNECMVLSKSSETLGEFIEQRKRWASKWRYHKDSIIIFLAASVAVFQALSIYFILIKAFKLLLIKSFLEFIFLSLVLIFLGKPTKIKFIPLVQLVYPFYVLFVAFQSQFKGKPYFWKGRELK